MLREEEGLLLRARFTKVALFNKEEVPFYEKEEALFNEVVLLNEGEVLFSEKE